MMKFLMKLIIFYFFFLNKFIKLYDSYKNNDKNSDKKNEFNNALEKFKIYMTKIFILYDINFSFDTYTTEQLIEKIDIVCTIYECFIYNKFQQLFKEYPIIFYSEFTSKNYSVYNIFITKHNMLNFFINLLKIIQSTESTENNIKGGSWFKKNTVLPNLLTEELNFTNTIQKYELFIKYILETNEKIDDTKYKDYFSNQDFIKKLNVLINNEDKNNLETLLLKIYKIIYDIMNKIKKYNRKLEDTGSLRFLRKKELKEKILLLENLLIYFKEKLLLELNNNLVILTILKRDEKKKEIKNKLIEMLKDTKNNIIISHNPFLILIFEFIINNIGKIQLTGQKIQNKNVLELLIVYIETNFWTNFKLEDNNSTDNDSKEPQKKLLLFYNQKKEQNNNNEIVKKLINDISIIEDEKEKKKLEIKKELYEKSNLCLVSLKFLNVIKEFKLITEGYPAKSYKDLEDTLPFFDIDETKPTFDLLCDTNKDYKISKQKIIDSLLFKEVLEKEAKAEETILKVEEDIIKKNKELSDILHLKKESSYKQKYLKYKQKYLELQKNKTI